VDLAVALVDAFTDRPFGGNPALVVLDASGLTPGQMQRIAGEMGVAGTGFVLPPGSPEAHFTLRVFTPAREVTYSGHTTLAVAHALAETGRAPANPLRLDTAGGRLTVEVEEPAAGGRIWLEPPLPTCRPFTGTLPPLLEAVGLGSSGAGRWAEPALTPEGDLLVPAPGLTPLRSLRPDMDRVATLAQRLGIRGICVVSRETVEPTSASHCRFFAPHVGIPEDIVTGSVHAAMARWLYEAGRVPAIRGRVEFTAEQGDSLGRPGRLAVVLEVEGRTPTRVRVGGGAVTVLAGTLRAPEA
jgi:PhzF family phenazine biosynthesis protein